MKRLLVAATLVAGTVSPAFAQQSPTSFSGPRVEFHAGWDWLSARTHSDDETTVGSVTNHNNDFMFGGQIGYDYAIRENTIVGVFGSYDVSNNKKCALDGFAATCLKANRNIEAGGRIGQVLGGNNLVYIKGAYVNGKFGASYNDPDAGIHYSDHEKRGGWRAGLGVEHNFGKYAYAKLEYNYSRYGRFNGELGDSAFSTRLTRQEALAGVGFRF